MMSSTLAKLGSGYEGTTYFACAVAVDWNMLDLAMSLYNHDIVVNCDEVVNGTWDGVEYIETHSEWPTLVAMCKEALEQGVHTLILYN